MPDAPPSVVEQPLDGCRVAVAAGEGEAEQDPRKAHPLTYARLGYDNLRAMAVAAGFEVGV